MEKYILLTKVKFMYEKDFVCYCDKSYKQGTLIIDVENNIYKVKSCVDLKWLTKGDKTGYYLTAVYLYKKDNDYEYQ